MCRENFVDGSGWVVAADREREDGCETESIGGRMVLKGRRSVGEDVVAETRLHPASVDALVALLYRISVGAVLSPSQPRLRADVGLFLERVSQLREGLGFGVFLPQRVRPDVSGFVALDIETAG